MVGGALAIIVVPGSACWCCPGSPADEAPCRVRRPRPGRRAGRGRADCDVFVCLGDLVLFLDYDDPSSGIFAQMFGAANAARYMELRYQLRFEEARAFSRGTVGGGGRRTPDGHLASGRCAVRTAVRGLPGGLFTYGNVDIPALWADYLRPDQHVLDGEVVERGGLRLGFVGGGLRTPMRTPFEISDESSPPRSSGSVRSTSCSATSRRRSRGHLRRRRPAAGAGSRVLREYIGDVQPRFALHGHVHQPWCPESVSAALRW